MPFNLIIILKCSWPSSQRNELQIFVSDQFLLLQRLRSLILCVGSKYFFKLQFSIKLKTEHILKVNQNGMNINHILSWFQHPTFFLLVYTPSLVTAVDTFQNTATNQEFRGCCPPWVGEVTADRFFYRLTKALLILFRVIASAEPECCRS